MSTQERTPALDEDLARLFFAPYLSKDEVKKLLCVGEEKLNEWIKKGLPVIVLSERGARIKRSDLDEFLTNNYKI